LKTYKPLIKTGEWPIKVYEGFTKTRQRFIKTSELFPVFYARRIKTGERLIKVYEGFTKTPELFPVFYAGHIKNEEPLISRTGLL
jgi:hypothetical protein